MYDMKDWPVELCNNRFTGTYFRLGKRFVQVNKVSAKRGKKEATVWCPESDEEITVPLEDLDFQPPELGFVDCDLPQQALLGVVNVRRRPVRNDWRQGIRAAQLYMTYHGTPVNASNLFGSKENFTRLRRAVTNKFATVKEAIDKLDEEYSSVALGHSFALSDQMKVLYEDLGAVGVLGWDRSVKLDAKYRFLKQRIEKELKLNAQ